MGRKPWISLLALVVMTTNCACGVVRGDPDREETFAVQGGKCSAQWWLEPQASEVPAAASEAAARALEAATVDPSELDAWKTTILESRSGTRELSESLLEGYAYVEVVRAEVRSGLSDAGFPDAPRRIIEATSKVECS